MKLQTSLEYLIIIAAVLAIVGFIVYFVIGSYSSSSISAKFSECKSAAAQCKSKHLVAPNDPCLFCEEACTINGVDLLEGTGYSAVELCRQGNASAIYQREKLPPACYNDSDCDDGNACTIDYCQNPGSSEAVCVNEPIFGCINTVGRFNSPDTAFDVIREEGKDVVFLADGSSVFAVNVSNKSSPSVISKSFCEDECFNLAEVNAGSNRFLVSVGRKNPFGSSSIYVFKVSGTSTLEQVFAQDVKDNMRDVFVDDRGYVFVVADKLGLLIYKIDQDTGVLSRISSFSIDGVPSSVTVVERGRDYVAYVLSSNGLYAVDVNDVSNPSLIGSINEIKSNYINNEKIISNEKLLYLSANSFFYVINVSSVTSDSFNPVIIKRVGIPSPAWDLYYSHHSSVNLVFAAASEAGVIVLNVTDPSSPHMISNWTSYSLGVCEDSWFVYSCAGGGGLYIGEVTH